MDSEDDMKLCECGCGGETPLATRTNTKGGRIKGLPTKFIHGHNPKKTTKARFCEVCDVKIQRHTFKGGRVEDRKVYLGRKFCSQECSVIAKSGPGAHNWNGGRRVDKDGYIYVLVGKDHHLSGQSGYALEHRVVAESKIGRRLIYGEVVHHKNHDRHDNRPENLAVMMNTDHLKMHRQGRTWEELPR